MKKFMSISALLSLSAFLMLPAIAGAQSRSTRTVRVNNTSSASVLNVSIAGANSGGNYADGSYGGDAGRAGDIGGSNSSVNDSSTGNGGNGGAANDGGMITTGTASTETVVLTDANTNRANIRFSDDGEWHDRETTRAVVDNDTRAEVATVTLDIANSGLNRADGSYGGDAGRAGDIDDNHSSTNGSDTGNGGHGGNGNLGGAIATGNARTSTSVVTVLNRNITRIR